MDERRNLSDFEDSPLKWRYKFTHVFFTFWKTVKMYGGENERIDEEIGTLRSVLNFFHKTQESLKITFDGIDVKLDTKHRIRGRRADDVYFEDLYDLFISICLAEVEFSKGVTDNELLSLFRTIGKFPLGREPKVTTYNRFLDMIPDAPLPHIKLKPYDPEEAGNLPLFSPEQRVVNIYALLIEEFIDQQQILKVNDSLPLKVIERSVQDLLTILLNNMHSKVWDFVVLLATTRTYNGSFEATEAVNRVFISAVTALTLSIEKKEAKYLLLAAFYNSLSNDVQKGFFALSRMGTFQIARAVTAVNSAFRLKDFHTDNVISTDTRLGSSSGEILKAISYYLAVTNPHTPQHLVDATISTRFDALRTMNKLTMKKGFVPEVISALRTSVGAIPIGSLVTYENETKIAVVIGRPLNGSNDITCVMVDHTMTVVGEAVLSLDSIHPVPAEQLMELPPETFQKILNSFIPQPKNSNDISENGNSDQDAITDLEEEVYEFS